MIISIKNKMYYNPQFFVENGLATLKIISEQSFSDIINEFTLQQGDRILQFNDNEEQIGEFYVEGMASVQLPGEDGSTVVTIKYKVNQLGIDVQEVLNDNIDLATLSILELATIVSNTKHNLEDELSHFNNTFEEHDNRLHNLETNQNTLIESVSHWESLFNILADRVATLENRLEEELK